MALNSVSSATLAGILQNAVGRMQVQQTNLETEATTGRLYDVGLTLGSSTGSVISLHQDMADFDSLTASNSIVTSQLDTAYAALTSVQKTTSSYLAQVVMADTVQPNTTGSAALQKSAVSGLDSFISMANAAVGDVYVFGGQNTNTAPVDSYATTAQPKVEAAFLAFFGFPVTSSQVSTIDATAMGNFLNGPFKALFTPNMMSTWSSAYASGTAAYQAASDTALQNRIYASQTITSSVTVNGAFQNVAMGLTMMAEFGGQIGGGSGSFLNADAYSALVSAAQDAMRDADNDIVQTSAFIGTKQAAINNASSSITLQQDVLTTRINAREAVDTYKVATEITALTNQLQVAFSLTSQIHKLSLVNFL